VLGENPIFSIPQGYSLDHAESLVLYAALGVASALMAVSFTESLLWLRKRFNAAKRLPLWLRPGIGGLATALIAITMVSVVHVRGVTGGGYEGLAGALDGNYTYEVMLALGAAKLVATVMSYSSGGSGGIFAPALFMGAMLGGAFGTLDVAVFGHSHAEVGSFALVGMGAVFAGVVRAPITSVLIIIEMTAGYGLTLPLMISNMMAYGVARQLRPTPIYEALLEQDGIFLHAKKPTTDAIDGLVLDRIQLDAGPHVEFTPKARGSELLEVAENSGRQEVFPVVDDTRRVVGLITLEDLTALADESDLEALVCATDLMRPPMALQPTDLASRALELMLSMGVRELPLVDSEGKLLGLITEAAIAHEYMRTRAAQRSDTGSSLPRPMEPEDG
jgi:CIC family chloride channel protein